MSVRSLAAAMSAALLCACLDDLDDDVALDELQRPLTCTSFGCPENSPVVGDRYFHELHRGGDANSQGLRIEQVRGPDGGRYTVDVRGDRLVALDHDGELALEGDALRGAFFVLQQDGGDASFEVQVAEIGEVAFWAPPFDPIPIYSFRTRRQGQSEWSGQLCRDLDATAILFAGDRYHADRSVTVGPDTDGWFNIACMGSASAKMHLMRYTEAGQHDDHTTNLLERQTMLRLLTATYCSPQPGSAAKSYTVAGEPLRIEIEPNVEEWTDITTYEAVWSSDGITCLEEPRLARTSQVPQSEADLVLADLDAQCGGRRPPPCSRLLPGFPSGWSQLGTMLSANRD